MEEEIKEYSPEEIYKFVPWDIFKNKKFVKNVNNLRGVIAPCRGCRKGILSFHLRFDYKGRKYRFDGIIAKPEGKMDKELKDINIDII